jgi:hypothetical protein
VIIQYARVMFRAGEKGGEGGLFNKDGIPLIAVVTCSPF